MKLTVGANVIRRIYLKSIFMGDHKAAPSRNVLTHIQELREWQKCQQNNLREIQQQNWKQLQQEQQRVHELLHPFISHQGSSIKQETTSKSRDVILPTKSVSQPVIESIKKTLTRPSYVKQDKPLETNENIQTSNKKSFPFLKKGEGLQKYKQFARSNKSSRKGCTKKPDFTAQSLPSNNPLPRTLPTKLKQVTFKENEDTKISVPDTLPVESTAVKDSGSEEENRSQSQNDQNALPFYPAKDVEELVEFEILEQVAHNCSLDSDSSLLNHLLSTKPNAQVKVHQENINDRGPRPVLTDAAKITSADEQRVSLNSSLISTSSSDTLSSSTEKCTGIESSEHTTYPTSAAQENKQVFDDEHSWKIDGELDLCLDSSSEQICQERRHQKLTGAFEEARSELLKVSEERASKDRLLLQERLKELEDEIEAFRKENSFLAKLRAQHEKMKNEFEKEKFSFKKKQEEEEKKFQEFIKEEKKKLRKQQQVFETHTKARQCIPDKSEREEISTLKNAVQKLQEENKKQRVQFSAECGRLRTHLASVESEKEKLHTQLQKTLQEKDHLLKEIKEVRAQPTNMENRPPQIKVVASKRGVHLTKTAKKKPILKANPKNNNVIKTHKNEVPSSTEPIARFDEEAPKENKTAKFNQTKLKTVHFLPDSHHTDVKEIVTTEEGMSKDSNPDVVVEEIQHFDKVEKILRSGEREFVYSSGTHKVISSDASTSQIFFYNGDVMITLSDKTEVYYFAASGTKQTKYPDGTVLLEYSDGQEEKLYENGMRQQKYQDGTVHITFQDGTQEIRSPDGTLLKIQKDGDEFVEFTNGEREIRTKDFKRREYLNGSSKTIYNDGRQETIYSDGRLRLKDKDGNIVLDTKYQ